MTSQSLRPSAVGRGLAQHKGVKQKHAIKQVYRLLSNEGIGIVSGQSALTQLLLSQRNKAVLAMDWTNFAKDKQTTLTLRHVTDHGLFS